MRDDGVTSKQGKRGASQGFAPLQLRLGRLHSVSDSLLSALHYCTILTSEAVLCFRHTLLLESSLHCITFHLLKIMHLQCTTCTILAKWPRAMQQYIKVIQSTGQRCHSEGLALGCAVCTLGRRQCIKLIQSTCWCNVIICPSDSSYCVCCRMV